MVMALVMVAMMTPSAAPFFIAYARDTKRPLSVAIIVLAYGAVWAAIGLAIGVGMNAVMMPSSLLIVAAALAFAGLYSLSPWSRRAHALCRDMCSRAPRDTGLGGAIADGLTYSGCCLACTAGLMVPLVVIGMVSPVVTVVGAALMVLYKLGEWRTLAAAA